MPAKGSRIPLATRLRSRLRINAGDGCWEWTGPINANGYGRMGMGGRNCRTVQAHRIAWELANGPIPDGVFVCHACDNRRCCRPDHLFLANHVDNMADMRRKQRAAAGERNSKTTITAGIVREIRVARAIGVSSTQLAVVYRLHPATIRRIVARKSWSHVA